MIEEELINFTISETAVNSFYRGLVWFSLFSPAFVMLFYFLERLDRL